MTLWPFLHILWAIAWHSSSQALTSSLPHLHPISPVSPISPISPISPVSPVSPATQAYSNRAASYIKLGALPEAKKDAEKCIEIDATFIKGYLRKGAAEFFMKEHDKAMKTYQEGLKLDPGNQELQEGLRR